MTDGKYPAFDGSQACAADPEPFYAADARGGAGADEAQAVCLGCVFVAECRAYALVNDVCGVWGAMTDGERRAWRRRYLVAEPRSVSSDLDDLVLAGRNARTGRKRASATESSVLARDLVWAASAVA